MCVCACVRACVRAWACECVRARVRAFVRDVFAIYDNNISRRLIMIIIKIIILYLSYISYKSDTLMIPLNGYPSSLCNN